MTTKNVKLLISLAPVLLAAAYFGLSMAIDRKIPVEAIKYDTDPMADVAEMHVELTGMQHLKFYLLEYIFGGLAGLSIVAYAGVALYDYRRRLRDHYARIEATGAVDADAETKLAEPEKPAPEADGTAARPEEPAAGDQ